MNDASESSFVTCVKLVENHAPKFMANRHALTDADRAVLLRERSILSIAPPLTDSNIETFVNKKQFGPRGQNEMENVRATAEILALGKSVKHGDAARIAKAHKANLNTVHKMVWNARRRAKQQKGEVAQ